jgi:hypothetical protein
VHVSTVRRRLRAVAVAVAVVVCAALGSGDARANMAKWWAEGEGHGPLVPQKDTDVRVDSEDLAFVLAPGLNSAAVTATYRMTNGSAVATSPEVAFVVVAGENREPAPEASIELDGAPVAFRVVTDAALLGAPLDAWLIAHPEIASELARLSAPDAKGGNGDRFAELGRLVPSCSGACNFYELLAWYEGRNVARTPGDDVRRNAQIVGAAKVAIPDDVAKLQAGWSKLPSWRRLSWLAFRLDFKAGEAHTVVVRYTHASGFNSRGTVNPTFTYDYLLSPAKRWARFGPLHLSVKVPEQTRLNASIPLTREGDTYRADLSGLPEGELSLHAMSLKGLLFGMTTPEGYWGLLLVALTAVSVALSVWLGRIWARLGSRLRVVLGCIFGTFVGVAVANGVVIWLLSSVLPRGAFGSSYGTAFGLLGTPLMFALGATVLSGLSARARRRT